MAIGAALIGGIAALGSSAIAASGSSTAKDQDQRDTSLEEMFSESFLETLTDTERSALETQVSTGTQASTEATTGTQVTDTTSDVAGTSTITRGTTESTDAINQILSGASSPDAEAAIQASIARVLESGAPSIANVGNAAGSFDSTVTAQLQNDLALQAAQAGAETDLAQQNLDIQNVLAAITASQAGSEGQATTQVGTETGESATTQDSTSATTTTDIAQSAIDETTSTASEQAQQESSSAILDAFSDVDEGSSGIDLRFNAQQQVIAEALAGNTTSAIGTIGTEATTVAATSGESTVSEILNAVAAEETNRGEFNDSILSNLAVTGHGTFPNTVETLSNIERGTGATDLELYLENFGEANLPAMLTRGKSSEDLAIMQEEANLAKFLEATTANEEPVGPARYTSLGG